MKYDYKYNTIYKNTLVGWDSNNERESARKLKYFYVE